MSYFALSWRFVARWKQKRPCSSFQGHLNTVSYVPCQNDINVFITTQWPLLLGGIQLFQQRSLTKATSVLPWPTGHFCWMRKAWETKKKKSNQRYVHTSTPLSLPAYRHVHLTLKFQCGILHIRSARLARNGTTPYLNREIQYSVPLNIKQLYFARGIESFTPAKHFSLPYAWPQPVERSHRNRRWYHQYVLLDQGFALNSVHITGKFNVFFLLLFSKLSCLSAHFSF